MSGATALPAGETLGGPSLREAQVRAEAAREQPRSGTDESAGLLTGKLAEQLSDEQLAMIRSVAQAGSMWRDHKTEVVVDGVESRTGYRLNQGAQGIVGIAIGIMATLMIGVVILGNIDQFANFGDNVSPEWNNTADAVTQQSSDTFSFLNLVPFLLVALFILGLMMSRM